MSERKLLEELLQLIDFEASCDEHASYTSFLIVAKKADEIKTQLETQTRSFKTIKVSNLQEYFCEYCIHCFDSFDCGNLCKTIATEFKEKKDEDTSQTREQAFAELKAKLKGDNQNV